MRAVGVHIHQYRGIRDLTLPLAPVTVLIGQSGSGKSSILEALGYVVSEEGALERSLDTPAVLSWYLRPAGDDALGNLGSLLHESKSDNAVDPALAIDTMAPHLVIRRDPDGRSWLALDLFHPVVDQLPTESMLTLQRWHRVLEPLGGTAGWARSIGDALSRGPDALPWFVDLGIELAGQSPGAPLVVTMLASPDDISRLLVRHAASLAHAAFAEATAGGNQGVADALAATREGQLRPLADLGLLEPVRRLLEDTTNALLPGFIGEHGTVRLVTLEGADDLPGGVARLVDDLRASMSDDVALALCDEIHAQLVGRGDTVDLHLDARFVGPRESFEFPYSRLGTGRRRWICGTIDEAARQLIAAYEAQPLSLDEIRLVMEAQRLEPRSLAASPVAVRLIDEPLEAIEQRVHGQVLAWMHEHVTESESLVMSSHQGSVLSAAVDPGDLEIIGLARIDGQVHATALGPDLLGGLQDLLGQIGLLGTELLFAARALLLVEGSNDIDLLTAIYGPELRARGVLVHPIGGSDAQNVIAALRHTAYRILNLPTWILYDGQPDDRLPPDLWCARSKKPHDGARAISDVARILGADAIGLLPFAPADIVLGVEPMVYRQLAQDRRWSMSDPFKLGSDADILQQWREMALSTTAKEWLRRHVAGGAEGVSIGVIVDGAAEVIGSLPVPARAANRWLESTMQRFFDELDAGSRGQLFTGASADRRS